MAPPPKINLLSKPTLSGAAGKARKGASLETPTGTVTRLPGRKLPDTPDLDWDTLSGPKPKPPPRDNADLGIRKLTTMGSLLDALGNAKTYRAWNLGQGMLVRAIRQISDEMGMNVPQRFGCATADELAQKLVALFKTQAMAEKLAQIKTMSAAKATHKLPGQIRHYGGYFWEEIAKLDEYLGRALARLAGERLSRVQADKQVFTLSTGARGKIVKTPVALSPGASFSKPLRSMSIAVKKRGNDKMFDSVDDLHLSLLMDKGVTYLVMLVRGQYKREKAAQTIRVQSDKDVQRWASNDLETLVLKDLLDNNSQPLSFSRERILFVEDSFSKPTGIVQDSLIGGIGKVQVNTVKTESGAELTVYSVSVDTKLHDSLLAAVLKGLPLPR